MIDFDNMENICGCGEPVRYSTPCGKGACNKHGRCPTYAEMRDRLVASNAKLYQIQLILDQKGEDDNE